MIIKLKRVAYAKPNTLDEDKEYQLYSNTNPFASVGTLSEWQKVFPTAKFEIVNKFGEVEKEIKQ